MAHTYKPLTLPHTLGAFIFHLIRQQPWSFIAMQFFAMAWAFDQTLFPLIISYVIDAMHNVHDKDHAWEYLRMPILWGFGLWVGVEVCYRLSGFLRAVALPQMEGRVRMSLFKVVQQHSHTYFIDHFAGHIANKIADMPGSLNRLLENMMTMIIPAVLAIAISVTLFYRTVPLFAWLMGSWIVMHMSIYLMFSKKAANLSQEHAETRSTLAGHIVDSLTNHMNRRLFARQAYETDYIQKWQNYEQKTHQIAHIYLEKVKVILGLLCLLIPGISLNWFAIYSWQNGSITIGDVVFIFNTTWNIVMITWLVGQDLPNIFKEIGICNQALSLIHDASHIADRPNASMLSVRQGSIEFSNVTFQYLKDEPLFYNKTVTIGGGDKVGLVGLSGSGKSTFVNLILRLFEIQSGTITIDGQDIAMVTQDSLRSNIAMIPQDPSLFHRTLMENIRYGRIDASDDDVIEAAKRAHAHEFIMTLEDGYQTLVGVRGIKLSGGQRQRIAIARAILKNAPIIILDEATSALDSVTENLIQDSLYKLIEDKTTIVIAHRLSTLLNMDRILVFHHGKIIEDGTHQELLHQHGHYTRLWNCQVGGFLQDTLQPVL